MTLKFEYVIIAILLVIILLQRACLNPTTQEVKTKVETIIQIDTLKSETPVYIPKWNTKVDVRIDTFTTPIDTVAILKNYYALYNYIDTVGTDSAKVIINDTISKNQIKSRKVYTQLLYPVITTTITKEFIIKKPQFYYGLGLGVSKQGMNNFGPELLYKTKNDQAYGLGLGVDKTFSPSINFKIYWKIGK